MELISLGGYAGLVRDVAHAVKSGDIAYYDITETIVKED